MTSTSLSPFLHPVLPPELECLVFQMAASNPRNVFNLMLVAWRVKEWVEPYLYHLISNTSFHSGMITTPFKILTLPIDNKPAGFWSNSVKSVFLDEIPTPDEKITRLFTACKGITRLSSHLPLNKHLDQLGALHNLRCLNIELAGLFRSNAIDLAHPLFRNVTHLEALDPPSLLLPPEIFAGLALVPRLTHLAFNGAPLYRAMLPFWASFTHLRSIVLLHPEALRAGVAREVPPEVAADDRFVLIGQTGYQVDWLRGANGGDDFWDIAKAFIKARRAGLVDRSLFSICDTWNLSSQGD
ncbi:hypothetical protein C8R46DRAFT_1092739 [Mycena filopes]|nr:hypothetical protein C8R46DRAFT_1092739 [Mycena filopes]